MQALKTRVNGHDNNLNTLDQAFWNFIKQTNQWFYKTTMTFNTHIWELYIYCEDSNLLRCRSNDTCCNVINLECNSTDVV